LPPFPVLALPPEAIFAVIEEVAMA